MSRVTRTIVPELPQSAREPAQRRTLDRGGRKGSLQDGDLSSKREGSFAKTAPPGGRPFRRKSTGDQGTGEAGSSPAWEVDKVAQELRLRPQEPQAQPQAQTSPSAELPAVRLRHRHSSKTEQDIPTGRRGSGAGGVGFANGGRLHTDMATGFPECPGAACAQTVYNRRKDQKLATVVSPSNATQSTDDPGQDEQSDEGGLSDSDGDVKSPDAGDAGDAKSQPLRPAAAKPPEVPRQIQRPSTVGGGQVRRTIRRNSTGSTTTQALVDGVRKEMRQSRRRSANDTEVTPGPSGSATPRRPSPLPPDEAPIRAAKSPRPPSKGAPPKAATERLPVYRRSRLSYSECQSLARGADLAVIQRSPSGGGGAVGSDARPQDDRSVFSPDGSRGGLEIVATSSGESRVPTVRKAMSFSSPHEGSMGSDSPKLVTSPGSSSIGLARQRLQPSRQDTFVQEAVVTRKATANSRVWSSAFRTVMANGEVTRDALPRAVALAGFLEPNEEWIRELAGQTLTTENLEVEDFFQLLKAYAARELTERMEAFEEVCDTHGCGVLGPEEVALVLKRLGVDVMYHVLTDMFREVNEGGSGSIGVDEFDSLMELLAVRQYFTRTEYQDFHAIFARYDREGSQTVNKEDVPSILGWLGYALDESEIERVTEQVVGSAVTEPEFISCMRKVHLLEMDLISKGLVASGESGDGTIEASQLEEVLRVLGYAAPDRDAVKEVAKDLDIVGESERLEVSDIWQFLIIYRAREGLNSAETSELKEAFLRYDKEHRGEISSLEVGKLLRWLGYQLPYEVLQQCINKVDVDESGALDFSELRKLIRMHRDRELSAMEEAFQAQKPISGTISVKQVRIALAQLGFLDGHAEEVALGTEGEKASKPFDPIPESEVKSGRVDKPSFLRVAVRASKASRNAFRRNGGFTSAQVKQLKHVFRRYDLNDSGSLCNKETILLVEDVLPDMAHDADMRPELIRLMKESDTDGNGHLEFQDFLRLMRQFHDVQDRERVIKEQNAIKDTGFSPCEVAGFRELFIAAAGDDCSGVLCFQGVCNLIGGVTPLGDKYMHQLTKIFDEVLKAHRSKAQLQKASRDHAAEAGTKEPADPKKSKKEEKGKSRSIDFPEFLWLMKRLMDTDFAGLKSRTSRGSSKTTSGATLAAA